MGEVSESGHRTLPEAVRAQSRDRGIWGRAHFCWVLKGGQCLCVQKKGRLGRSGRRQSMNRDLGLGCYLGPVDCGLEDRGSGFCPVSGSGMNSFCKGLPPSLACPTLLHVAGRVSSKCAHSLRLCSVAGLSRFSFSCLTDNTVSCHALLTHRMPLPVRPNPNLGPSPLG